MAKLVGLGVNIHSSFSTDHSPKISINDNHQTSTTTTTTPSTPTRQPSTKQQSSPSSTRSLSSSISPQRQRQSIQNRYIQKYGFNQRYPFTEKQITFLLQLQHYLHQYEYNDSVKPHCCSSSIVSVSAKDCIIQMFKHSQGDLNHGVLIGSPLGTGPLTSSSSLRRNNHIDTNNLHHISDDCSVMSGTSMTSYGRPGSPVRSIYGCGGGAGSVAGGASVMSGNFKKPSVLNAFQWVDNHLIIPYYSKSFLMDLIHCARHHSYVFLPNNIKSKNGNGKGNSNGNGEDKKHALSMHLFLEAMGGLCGRKGGPAFEIKVLFEYILRRNEEEKETSSATPDDDDKEENVFESKGTFDNDDSIDVEEMIAFIYRLALSCHVLQNWTVGNDDEVKEDEDEDDDDINNDLIFNSNTEMDLEHIASLGQIPPRNIIESLGSYTSSSGSDGIGATAGSAFDEKEIKDQVDYETFRNWVEIHFPQMASIMSTFIHLAFFSWGNEYDDGDNVEDESVLQENPMEDNVDDDIDDEEVEMTMLSMYAQGKRKMFQFPQLEQLVVGKTVVNKSITKNIIATPPATSILFDTETFTYKDKSGNAVSSTGSAGHFAFGMACMDSNLSSKWYRLYSTENDGFAFVNMQRALTGYTGPTVMIVRPTNATSSSMSSSTTPGLFGFYTSDPWKESNKFYGTSDCFLFRAEPTWNVYRPQSFVQGWKIEQGIDEDSSASPLRKKKMKENFMYFRPTAGHIDSTRNSSGSGVYGSTKANRPFGIIMGGSTDQPRFQITESFEQCIAASGTMTDLTFESGPLLPGQWDKFYNIDVLEVWGIGGEDVVRGATSAKERHEDIVDAARKKVQMVDKKQFLDDFKSGMSGEKLFQHRLDDNVRHDFSGATK